MGSGTTSACCCTTTASLTRGAQPTRRCSASPTGYGYNRHVRTRYAVGLTSPRPLRVVRHTPQSYRFQCKNKNIGWRLDYALASDTLATSVRDSFIRRHMPGSDHCPIGLVLDVAAVSGSK